MPSLFCGFYGLKKEAYLIPSTNTNFQLLFSRKHSTIVQEEKPSDDIRYFPWKRVRKFKLKGFLFNGGSIKWSKERGKAIRIQFKIERKRHFKVDRITSKAVSRFHYIFWQSEISLICCFCIFPKPVPGGTIFNYRNLFGLRLQTIHKATDR